MKLNVKQPYGHIYGNHAAVYTQNGHFFDGAGNEVDTSGDIIGGDEDEEGSPRAELFLTELLSGGALSKKKVADAAEREDIPWVDIENAANAMDIVKFKVGVVMNWRLNQEQ